MTLDLGGGRQRRRDQVSAKSTEASGVKQEPTDLPGGGPRGENKHEQVEASEAREDD